MKNSKCLNAILFLMVLLIITSCQPHKKFEAGEYQVPCALIIGKRKPSTDLKTSLNDALREYNVAV